MRQMEEALMRGLGYRQWARGNDGLQRSLHWAQSSPAGLPQSPLTTFLSLRLLPTVYALRALGHLLYNEQSHRVQHPFFGEDSGGKGKPPWAGQVSALELVSAVFVVGFWPPCSLPCSQPG